MNLQWCYLKCVLKRLLPTTKSACYHGIYAQKYFNVLLCSKQFTVVFFQFFLDFGRCHLIKYMVLLIRKLTRSSSTILFAILHAFSLSVVLYLTMGRSSSSFLYSWFFSGENKTLDYLMRCFWVCSTGCQQTS